MDEISGKHEIYYVQYRITTTYVTWFVTLNIPRQIEQTWQGERQQTLHQIDVTVKMTRLHIWVVQTVLVLLRERTDIYFCSP
jgi:hypothetical protein